MKIRFALWVAAVPLLVYLLAGDGSRQIVAAAIAAYESFLVFWG